MYEINHRNADIDDLPFDGDERLVTIQKIYRMNYDIIERLKNSLIIDVYTNKM